MTNQINKLLNQTKKKRKFKIKIHIIYHKRITLFKVNKKIEIYLETNETLETKEKENRLIENHRNKKKEMWKIGRVAKKLKKINSGRHLIVQKIKTWTKKIGKRPKEMQSPKEDYRETKPGNK